MTVDLTGVAVAFGTGVLSILGTVLTAWITKNVNDKAAAANLSAAVQNSLGAIQQAAVSGISIARPRLEGVPPTLASGVQYVLDHAGEEAARFNLTPTSIAQKIEAQIGLKNIATNIAVAGSPATTVPDPLKGVPVKA